ncbi:MAG TPA: FHA domain-containing protein [Stenomitos sp.]
MDTATHPQLIVQTPDGVRQIELIEHQEWSIGRDRTNLIRIPDRYASRFHASITVYRDRHCYFWDLNSRNGSLLNEQPIVGSALLKHGDRITIGNTLLTLKHHFVSNPNLQLSLNKPQVLMVHTSAIQGKIWQELLLSQAIDICWEVPGVDLKNLIALKAAANVLPPLLILDMQAFQEDLSSLCQWCRLQKIAVRILLIDSSRTQIPKAEQTDAIAQGFLHCLPALPTDRLLALKPFIFKLMLSILKEFQHQTLNSDTLNTALQTLDQLLQSAPLAPYTPQSDNELDIADQEDPTTLQASTDPAYTAQN